MIMVIIIIITFDADDDPERLACVNSLSNLYWVFLHYETNLTFRAPEPVNHADLLLTGMSQADNFTNFKFFLSFFLSSFIL